MSENSEMQRPADDLPAEGGVGMGVGEPSSFEPEEDAESLPDEVEGA